MDILLTLPPNAAAYVKKHREDFPGITGVYSDPEGVKLGSGGGTVNVLWQHYTGSEVARKRGSENINVIENRQSDNSIVNRKSCAIVNPAKRIIIHADGESRRLPAYAPMGKSLIPFPVFKWGRGQRIDQTLFDVQRGVLEQILERAPAGLNTMVASGDALVWMEGFNGALPEADVVCMGVWSKPEVATRHGVFVCPRHDPGELSHMLQKPSLDELQGLTGEYLYLLDAGIWLLSDRAVEQLFKGAGWDRKLRVFKNRAPEAYDLYSEFGMTLGTSGKGKQALTVRIVPLERAEFFHFGSNADLLASTTALHNRVVDQREIWHKKVKPAPGIFVQNAVTHIPFGTEQVAVWIENSFIPIGWRLHSNHLITGVPTNDWTLDLPAGICIDFVPIGSDQFCIRSYGFADIFRGLGEDPETIWHNQPMANWFADRGFTASESSSLLGCDCYDAPLFPVMKGGELSGEFLQWMVSAPARADTKSRSFKNGWLKALRLSAADLIRVANLSRLNLARWENLKTTLPALAANHHKSVFYQLDLKELASTFGKAKLGLPPLPDPTASPMTHIHDRMFRSAYHAKRNRNASEGFSRQAFSLLREGMLAPLHINKPNPVLQVQSDQIVWGRSPVRLDLAGGWTDTPPYCTLYGGRVINMAVDLNGQPPIQVYLRRGSDPVVRIHSIDQGLGEVVTEYREIAESTRLGSAFTIPKAALLLAGFHPDTSAKPFTTLKSQLQAFGGGIDITLMVAVPKGSGLGTSSILAATLLGALSEFCGLGWDRQEIAARTLMLEQILTTGGGWQDQFGGLFEGVKLLESSSGLVQSPSVRWAPDYLFTHPTPNPLVLLYYTGITRIAKHILADIVKGMFLNSNSHLTLLAEMKQHARDTYEAILHHDWNGLTLAIRRSWELNQRLDAGTNPPEIAAVLHRISDYMISAKLLGAGGGGYLMIFAKDLKAAEQIRTTLRNRPQNDRARFVSWSLSAKGLEVTRS